MLCVQCVITLLMLVISFGCARVKINALCPVRHYFTNACNKLCLCEG